LVSGAISLARVGAVRSASVRVLSVCLGDPGQHREQTGEANDANAGRRIAQEYQADQRNDDGRHT
jgi:hypothetical protein